jgi:two-component system cell cycle sensor histidine kinase PleC
MCAKPTHSTRVDFGRKTQTVHVEKQAAKTNVAEQMRIVVGADGKIIFANDAFAARLSLGGTDLVGRQILDTVLFDDYKSIMNDRAIFNNMSHGQTSEINNLHSGEHIIILGDQNMKVPFYFDWVQAGDKGRYLVACSIATTSKSKQSKPDWASIIEGVLPSNESVDTEHLVEPQNTLKINDATTKKTASKPTAVGNNNKARVGHAATQTTISDMRHFKEMNSDLLCVIENDGTILRTNKHFIAKLGLEDKAIQSFIDLIYPDDRAQVRQYLQSLTSHDEEDGFDSASTYLEARMICGEGMSIWTKWNIRTNRDQLYCLGYDITTTKINEQALIRREQELSEAQALANMGHWRWRVGSTAIEWSDQIYQIFGVNRGEFEPTLDNTNQLLHKRDIGRMMQAFQRAIIEQNNYDLDFRVVRPDQSIRYVRCEGRCELDSDGDAIALYGVMQDVTEQTEHEMALREAKESAEQAYAAKSRFLANMSHELRTPLNAIIGFSDMIERQMLGPLGSEKYVDYASSIKDSGEHLLDLITDILDMSKIEAGKYDLDLEKIQLGNVVNTAVRMIESRANDGVLKLENTVESDDPIVVADRRAVMQILLNVLSNAVKFTEPGGTISVSCEEFEHHVTIKIMDTGIGIPANKLNAVMRPFEQVSTAFTRNHEGSGLGLAITKELAELHGGMLNLESTVGQGTIASLRLPRDASTKQKSRH